ncbi:MAG: ANTAR domain-containing response regulator [Ruminiclostridium sp.]
MKKPLRILLAEDEYLCLMGIKNNLKLLGHEVIGECGDGNELIELALRGKPDIIITDISMNSLDGIEAIRRINKVMFIPSIIVSGYDDKELIERATKQGVFSYLMKPIDIKDIKVAIEVTMAKYEEFNKLKKELISTQESLESRKFVEKAKGILMDRLELTESGAMKKLQKMSKDNNKKMVAIAKEIIRSNEILS